VANVEKSKAGLGPVWDRDQVVAYKDNHNYTWW